MVLLSQGNGFLRTDFLAAEPGDARVGIHYRKTVFIHGQSRYRELIDAGTAARAQLRIGLRVHDYAITNKRLYGLVV